MKQLRVNLNMFLNMDPGQTEEEAADKLGTILYDALQQYNNIEYSEFFDADVIDDGETDNCPLSGDTSNNCEGCVYSGDYKYDKDTKECVRREQE
jgi:hypothetical protein